MNKATLNKAGFALNLFKNLVSTKVFVFVGLLFFIGFFTISIHQVSANSSGPNNSSNITTWSGIDQPWVNESDAATSDNAYAEVTVESFQTSDYLVLDNFGFSIPTGATITGIGVTVERQASTNARIADTYLSLLVGGSPSGSNLANTGAPWGTAETSVDYGGSGNTWGNSLTASDVNDSSFGVVFMLQSTASKGAIGYVDNIRVTVFYSPPYGLTSTQSGNWTAGTTWGGSCSTGCSAGVDYPGITESVTIASGHNVTVPADTTIGSVSVNGGGTLTLSSGVTLTLGNTGTPLSISGTFTPGTGTVKYMGSSANIAPTTYYNLTCGDGVASVTDTLSGTTTVTNVLTVSANASFLASSYTLNLNGSGTPVVRSGTFTPGTGTVNYTSGSGITALSSAAITYYNLVINGTGTFNTGAISSVFVSNDLTVTSGTLTGAVSFEVDGGDVTGNGVINMTGSVFYLFGSGTGTFGGNSNWSFNQLVLGEDDGLDLTATGSGSITTSTLIFNAIVNAGSKTWIITGSGTPFTGPIDNYGTSTFRYTSASGATVNTNTAFYNLEISPASGTPTFSLPVASNLSTINNFTVSGVSGTTFSANNASSYVEVGGTLSISTGNTFVAPPSGGVLYIGANFSNSGTFTHNSCNIYFTSTSTGRTISTNGSQLNNVSFVGSGGGWSPSSAMVLAGDLTMSSGTLSGTQNITVNGGDVTGNATINMTGGTFLVDGTSGTGFGGNTAWTFNNLTFGDGSGSATTTAIGTGSITVTGVLTTAVSQTLNAGSKTYILSGTGTPLVNNGGFQASTSTFQYTGTSATLIGFTYNNITLGGTGTYTLPSSTSLTGNLVVTSGATVIKGASGISFIGTSPQTITDNNSSKQDLGAVTISNTAAAWCNISSTACNSSWLNRKKITMDNSTLSSSLTNYPVLVSLTSANIDYSKTLNSGQDIRFVDADGVTALNYEIESWDESGTSLVWVKVPTVSNNNTDFFWMYYNNVAATDNQSKTSVWDSNYKAVYHLPNGSSLSGSDSTSNAYNLSNVGSTTATAGKVGGAANLNGSNQYLGNTSVSITTGSSISISFWQNIASGDVSTGSAFNIGAADEPNRIQAHAPYTDNTLYWDYGSYASGGRVSTSYASYLNAWAYVTLEYNSSSSLHAIYLNGALANSSTSSNTPNSTRTGLEIGRWIGYQKAKIDEFRVSTVARGADWIKADYNSANNTMNTFGAEESTSSLGVSMGSSLKMTSVTVSVGSSFGMNGSNTLTLTGNSSPLSVSGSFAMSTGTIDFSSASTTGTTIPALTYYNLTLNKAGNTFTAAGNITANNFSITAGSFTAPTTLTINGDFVNSGTFNANSGTVVIAPTSTALSSSISAASTTFYNLTTTTPGASLKFKSGTAFTISNTLTVTGVRGNPTWLISDSQGSTWTITLSANPSLSYVNVRDAICSGGVAPPQNSLVFNVGNNSGTCFGFTIFHAGGGSSGGGAGSSGSSTGGGGSGGSGGSRPIQATATATQTGGVINNSVSVTNAGSGYTTTPSVCISGSGGGSGAIAVATLSSGTISQITISNGGSGYSGTITVGIEAPPGDGGSACSSGSGGGSGGGGGASP